MSNQLSKEIAALNCAAMFIKETIKSFVHLHQHINRACQKYQPRLKKIHQFRIITLSVDYIYWLKSLDTKLNESTNQNSLPKIVRPTNKETLL